MKPLLSIVLIACMIVGAISVGAFAEQVEQSRSDWLLLAIAHLILLAWAGVVIWWTRTHELWLNTSRKVWLVAMVLAYLVGAAGGVYVFVFS